MLLGEQASFEVGVMVTSGNNAESALQVVYSMADEKTSERKLFGRSECANEQKPTKLAILTRNVSRAVLSIARK